MYLTLSPILSDKNITVEIEGRPEYCFKGLCKIESMSK